MKLDTKEQHLRDQLGLVTPHTAEEVKILDRIEVTYIQNETVIIVRSM